MRLSTSSSAGTITFAQNCFTSDGQWRTCTKSNGIAARDAIMLHPSCTYCIDKRYRCTSRLHHTHSSSWRN